ncbi:MAG: tetratricopeptide repeat protein [Dehalococcoidia bacterium]
MIWRQEGLTVGRLVFVLMAAVLVVAVLYGCSAPNPAATSNQTATSSPAGTPSKPVGREVLDPLTDQFNEQGIIFLGLGRYEDAVLLFNEAVAQEPTVGYLYRNRGLAYSETGDLDTANSDYTKAIAYNKDDFLAYFYRGYDYGVKKAYDQAMADLNSSLNLNPKFADSYLTRGQVNKGLGKNTEALADFKSAIAYSDSKNTIDQARQEIEKLNGR